MEEEWQAAVGGKGVETPSSPGRVRRLGLVRASPAGPEVGV